MVIEYFIKPLYSIVVSVFLSAMYQLYREKKQQKQEYRNLLERFKYECELNAMPGVGNERSTFLISYLQQVLENKTFLKDKKFIKKVKNLLRQVTKSKSKGQSKVNPGNVKGAMKEMVDYIKNEMLDKKEE